jgi:hypothetical protein
VYYIAVGITFSFVLWWFCTLGTVMCEDLNGSNVKSPIVVTFAFERDIVLSAFVDRRPLFGSWLASNSADVVGVMY